MDGNNRAGRLRAGLVAAAGMAAAAYLTARLSMMNPAAYAYSVLFFAVEALATVQALIFFVISLQSPVRKPRPAKPGLSVDVLVPTLNENYDVVRRTLVAATRIAYPHQTFVLDDGNRAQIRALAEELGCRYIARSGRDGAKAGNLNAGLAQASGAFVAIFDADHAPQPDFLDRLLGYFDDPDLAIVQTPQDYFNTDAFQFAGSRRRPKLIWHDQSPFHYVDQPSRDGWGAATLCGCSAILRRAHLDRIGGFPAETVTEDMHTAVKLQKLGLKTLYHPEPLAFGIAAADYRGYLRQRLRWGEGNMQVCRMERIPFTRDLTWRQNVAYMLLAFPYLNGWLRAVVYTAPIIALTTGALPMRVSLGDFAIVFVPYAVLMTLAFEEVCRGYGRTILAERHALARVLIGIGATAGLVRRTIAFKVTSKSLAGRPGWVALLPFAALFLGGVLAVLWAMAQRLRAGAPSAEIPDGMLALFSALALWHSWSALRLIGKIRHAGGGESESYAHTIGLPVTFGGGRAVFTRQVSLDHLAVDAAVPEDVASVTIHLPGSAVRVGATHAGGHRLALRWPSLRDRDILDQSLHAGAWTRFVNGLHERDLTPLERIGLIQPAAGTRRGETVYWTPALVEAHGGKPRLAYVARTAEGMEVVLFGEPETTVRVLASPDATLAGRTLDLTPSGIVSRPGGRFLESAGGRCYGARLRQSA